MFNKIYLELFSLVQILVIKQENKMIEQIKDMLVNVETKESFIIIDNIKNRYIELA